jgi:hypothetical protein
MTAITEMRKNCCGRVDYELLAQFGEENDLDEKPWVIEELVYYLNNFFVVDVRQAVPMYGETDILETMWRTRQELLDAHEPIKPWLELWLRSPRRQTRHRE